jgi:hypothetical protein
MKIILGSLDNYCCQSEWSMRGHRRSLIGAYVVDDTYDQCPRAEVVANETIELI